MAKSARASTKKRNNAKLRSKVFGPAYDARTERLSAKLQELANAPKPEQDKSMEVDDTQAEEVKAADVSAEAQDEDIQWTGLTSNRKASSRKSSNRINKVMKRKPKNQMVFPSEMARKKRQAKGRRS